MVSEVRTSKHFGFELLIVEWFWLCAVFLRRIVLCAANCRFRILDLKFVVEIGYDILVGTNLWEHRMNNWFIAPYLYQGNFAFASYIVFLVPDHKIFCGNFFSSLYFAGTSWYYLVMLSLRQFVPSNIFFILDLFSTL